MKRALATLGIIFLTSAAFPQIDIRKEAVETLPVFKPMPYDSLTPFEIRGIVGFHGTKEEKKRELDKQFLKYVGQTIFFVPDPTAKDPYMGPFRAVNFFYLNKKGKTNVGNLLRGATTSNVYKAAYSMQLSEFYTPYKAFLGKYFKIIGVRYEFSDTYKDQLRNIDLVLTDENQDTLVMRNTPHNWEWKRFPDFIVMGYYQKQKQRYVGKEFVFSLKHRDLNYTTIDNITGKIVKLDFESEWTCSALELLNLKDGRPLQLFLIFKNDKNEEIRARLEKMPGDNSPVLISYFTEKQRSPQYKERKRQEEEEAKKWAAIAETERTHNTTTNSNHSQSSSNNDNSSSTVCRLKGIPLYGRVRVVDHYGADFKVRVVDYFPYLRVRKVDFSPNACGEWQFVEFGQDFTIRYVDYGEDFTIRFVDFSPGTD